MPNIRGSILGILLAIAVIDYIQSITYITVALVSPRKQLSLYVLPDA